VGATTPSQIVTPGVTTPFVSRITAAQSNCCHPNRLSTPFPIHRLMAVSSKRSSSTFPSRLGRRGRGVAGRQPRTPVIGIEAEFTVYVKDEKCLPEQVFRSPQALIRDPMIPRTGRSFHLPSGGALYFDTGVVEVATPIIEIESGCCLRVVRSLWEQIEFVRKELDAWEEKQGSSVRLEGFSTHYNISVPAAGAAHAWRLAKTLTFLLHPAVMLLAANRLSTGVGVRPRGNRVEVTVDFTPDPALMLATTAFIVGVVLEVLDWSRISVGEMTKRGNPVIEGFAPCRHTSRKGFLARHDCFPKNPFATDPNEETWRVTDGRTLSLRQIATEIALPFRNRIRQVADKTVVRHILAVLSGSARSLLDFPERPRRYEDAGRDIDFNRRGMRTLPRSRYEKVIRRVITHEPIQVGRSLYRPERMQGWYEISFRNTRTGHLRIFNLDDLARHCAV
jgi:hypothetical protein